MGCCCTADERIIIVRKNDTDFNNGNLVEFNITSDIYNVADFTAELILGDIKREFDDLSSGTINFNLSKEETATLPYGNIDGVMNFIDSQGRVATISSIIPFRVVGIVENDAIKTSDVNYTINVEQGGQNIFNIDVKTNVSVSVGTVETLPAGSSAYVENVGTSQGVVLNFGIPRGENGIDGQSATVDVGTTQTLPTGQDAYVENVGTTTNAIFNFGIPRGEQGEKGEKGNDATINGYNSISLLGSNGVSISQNGSETIVSGETLQEGITNINDLIPTQATEQNQLADKAFVNSSINNIAAFYITSDVAGDPFPTRAALIAGPWYFRGELRQPTQNDYALVSEDETHEDMTSRFMYDGNQWVWQYTLNNTQFTQAQIDAINSGITSSLATKIGTNESKIGNLSSLSTSVKSDLVSAINEVNTTAGSKVSDVQISGTSITTSGVANIPLMDSTAFGVAKLGPGLQIGSSGDLKTYQASDAEIVEKSNAYNPITPARLDAAVKVGITTNTNTLTTAEKQTATNWILPTQTNEMVLGSDGTNASWDYPVEFIEWSD